MMPISYNAEAKHCEWSMPCKVCLLDWWGCCSLPQPPSSQHSVITFLWQPMFITHFSLFKMTDFFASYTPINPLMRDNRRYESTDIVRPLRAYTDNFQAPLINSVNPDSHSSMKEFSLNILILKSGNAEKMDGLGQQLSLLHMTQRVPKKAVVIHWPGIKCYKVEHSCMYTNWDTTAVTNL